MKRIFHNVQFLPTIITVVLTVLIVGGGIFWWVNQKQTSTVVPTPLQTGMLRYQSTNGFRIDYPDNWRLSSVIDNYGSIKEAQRVGGNYFQIFSYPENNSFNPGAPVSSDEIKIETFVFDGITTVSLDEWIGSFGFENILRTENIIINGKIAKKILYFNADGGGGGTDKFLVVFYLDGSKGVRFHCYPSDTRYSKEFDTVVKTFSFDR